MIKSFGDLLIRFRKDERGVFLVFFALIGVVLIAASGAVVDFTRVQQARTRAQIAIDGAALALQETIHDTGVTAATLKDRAQALLTERIADSTITAVIESATPDLTAGKLTIMGYISVPTYFVQLVGIKDIRSAMLAEVTRSSNDIEVSVALDVTGSMAGSKITSLKSATNTLIDLLVKDTQTPTYSKMAIVPWANGVNLSSTYSNSIRGTPTAGVPISAITWYQGTSRNINGITNASQGVITVSGTTGLSDGNWVYISGVAGMTQINGRIGTVTGRTVNSSAGTTSFRLTVNGNILCTSNTAGCGWYGTYSASSGDTVRRCIVANCLERVTTSAAHGIASGESVYITGTVGTTGINDTRPYAWTPTIINTTSYYLPGTSPANGIRTSGGTSWCAKYGCQYMSFTNAAGGPEVWQINNCGTERRVTNAYDDMPPSTTKVGMSYRDGAADCIPQVIVPLTSNKTTLKALVATIAANGSTAGQIGLAWGWYMIAPNWAYLWPTASQPKAYGSANLIKAVIFMTDGEFNTVHCKGVISADTLSNSNVASSERINCNSDNGLSSKDQAQKFCDAIKVASNKTLLYTVGFDLANNASALTFLRNCATSADHFYQADTGADLEDAFSAIAQSLSELRISK